MSFFGKYFKPGDEKVDAGQEDHLRLSERIADLHAKQIAADVEQRVLQNMYGQVPMYGQGAIYGAGAAGNVSTGTIGAAGLMGVQAQRWGEWGEWGEWRERQKRAAFDRMLLSYVKTNHPEVVDAFKVTNMFKFEGDEK